MGHETPGQGTTRTPVSLPPDMIASILAEYDKPEVLAEIQEMLAGGGLQFEDFYPELEALCQAVAPRPAGA